MKINEAARLTGVTVRTLHYYDEIGLLRPSELTDAGYRLYDEAALETLQQILFFRELDFSLSDIRRIMADPHYSREEALRRQKELLCQKRDRLEGLIDLVDASLKGENDMSFKQFDMTQIEENKKKYAAEVKERWGGTEAYAESERKTGGYSGSQWQALTGEVEAIIRQFADSRALSPESPEAQALVKKWQEHISANFYRCTDQILAGLGAMYVGDERFTQNIDANGEGTAAFMAAAIEAYCAK